MLNNQSVKKAFESLREVGEKVSFTTLAEEASMQTYRRVS